MLKQVFNILRSLKLFEGFELFYFNILKQQINRLILQYSED